MSLSMLYQSCLDHTRNLGKREDVLTGMLCACLEQVPAFRVKFLDFLGLGEYASLMNREFGCHTGDVVKPRGTFPWYRGDCFKPDVWIFETSSDNWHTSKPKSQFNLLIESKVHAAVSPEQRRGYRALRDSMPFAHCALVLICVSPDQLTAADHRVFGHSIVTWSTIASLARQVARRSGADVLHELSSLVLRTLYPSYEESEPLARFLHRVLASFRLQIQSRGEISPFHVLSSGLREVPEDTKKEIKWLRLADRGRGRLSSLWLAACVTWDDRLQLRLETWASSTRGADFQKSGERLIGDVPLADIQRDEAF